MSWKVTFSALILSNLCPCTLFPLPPTGVPAALAGVLVSLLLFALGAGVMVAVDVMVSDPSSSLRFLVVTTVIAGGFGEDSEADEDDDDDEEEEPEEEEELEEVEGDLALRLPMTGRASCSSFSDSDSLEDGEESDEEEEPEEDEVPEEEDEEEEEEEELELDESLSLPLPLSLSSSLSSSLLTSSSLETSASTSKNPEGLPEDFKVELLEEVPEEDELESESESELDPDSELEDSGRGTVAGSFTQKSANLHYPTVWDENSPIALVDLSSESESESLSESDSESDSDSELLESSASALISCQQNKIAIQMLHAQSGCNGGYSSGSPNILQHVFLAWQKLDTGFFLK